MLYEIMCDTLHPPSKMASIIVSRNVIKLQKKKKKKNLLKLLYPRSPKGEGGILFYLCPSKKYFVAFFSVTVDGRNLIFGHKRHIGIPYCGKRFWTHQIPTSCLATLLIFIHIEHICSFFVAFFSATIDGRNLIFGHKLHIVHIGTPYRGKRFWTHQISTSCLPT
jgi:hypothetical protein